MSTVYEIIVNDKPPKPADKHYMTIHRIKNKWTQTVYWLAKEAKIPPLIEGEMRRVDITFERKGVASDKDNNYARCKIPIDALVKAGLLHDDNPRYLDLHASSVTTRTAYLTRIIITTNYHKQLDNYDN